MAFANEDELTDDIAETWRRCSLQMHRLCAENGIRYLHFLQPNQYAGPKPMSDAEREIALETRPMYGRHARDGYPLLRAAGAELAQEGVAFFDLTAVFEDVEDPVYIDDCCHINPTGNTVVAREIAVRILATLDGAE